MRRVMAAIIAAVVLQSCMPAAHRFEGLASTWTAELRDLTGTVDALYVRAEPISPAALEADGMRVTALGPGSVEVAWLGDSCQDKAMFCLLRERDGLELRYTLGAPCRVRPCTAYAIELRFDRPIEASTISPVPDEGP
jgi:hypothetical protein